MKVTLDCFSGRPNPEWRLTPDQEREFENRFHQLTKGDMLSYRDTPILGYRGLHVTQYTSRGITIHAYNESVTIIDGNTTRSYLDVNREFEYWLLTTGYGHIPDNVYTSVSREINPPPTYYCKGMGE